VALESLSALTLAEIKDLLGASYRLVFEKLPKKTQLELAPVQRRRT
jgi:predicted DNA-binding protein (MmcQ/YjbR family)